MVAPLIKGGIAMVMGYLILIAQTKEDTLVSEAPRKSARVIGQEANAKRVARSK